MSVEVLSSNVVNYLVWRYLQEAGYGSAALQLSRCWNRDPESLPFAGNVAQHTLINLLQDGMWFDRLQAEATNSQQRYHFGHDHGRPYSDRNGNLLTLDQGIPAYQLAEEANGQVQSPPPKKGKRKKAAKTNGVVQQVAPIAPAEAQINGGDAMDVEHNGHTHVTNSVRAESEGMPSDVDSPSVAELTISTLSIGQSTEAQTDLPKDLAPRTHFECSVKEKTKKATQTLWSTKDPLLVVAGTNLLRLHIIPQGARATSVDLSMPAHSFDITALCWNDHNELTVSAREEQLNEFGESLKTDRLYRIVDGGENYRVISSTSGLVTTLRWNEEKRLLLSVSSDGREGRLRIFSDAGDDADNQVPTWMKSAPTTIYDALWISDSSFVVCGAKLLELYELDEKMQVTGPREHETDITWEEMKYDAGSGIVAMMGISHLGILHPSNPDVLQVHDYPEEGFCHLDFRPQPRPAQSDALGISSPSSPVLLATCSLAGVVCIWDANQPLKCLKRLHIMDDSLTNEVAWSPNGKLLAAAGPEVITVWDVDQRDEPVATWRARDFPSGEWDSSVDGEVTIGWDPDSTRLSVALGNQIAVVTV